MKKNRMMRLASMLLVAVMMTTCTISGTFAKYVTSASGEDTARVAKWGVQITPEGKMFFVDYDGKDGGAQVPADTVYSTSAKVVAPGTAGDLTNMTFIGKPEVAFKIEYAPDLTLTGWEDANGDYYCPLEITVGSDTYKGLGYSSINLFEDDVEAAIEAYGSTYGPNTDLSTDVAIPGVSWSWPFSTSNDNDVKDTFLGDEANAGRESTIKLSIETTITQID